MREHEQVEAWRCYDPAYVQEVMRVRTMERWNDESITALEFLSAAIVRDFWVVEDRGDALRLGAPRFRQALGAADTRKRVIYLPRCRYDRRHVERAVAGEAATWRVSPHFVGPHFRTLPDGHTATRKQRAVAALHGVAIPTGKTWVRGHVAAGGEEEAKVFRSRTACRTLLEVLDLTRPSNALRGLSWYQFERLCERLIEERGYAVVDKVGDNGIDILAADVAGHTLLGQAKHWTKPVGPGVVRDMVGARAAFVRDQGGDAAAMILSSSGFTASARADAAAAGIELVTVSTR